MTKIELLTHAQQLLEQQVEALVSETQQEDLAASSVLGQLQDLRTELLAHLEGLQYAELACAMGQRGEVPNGWHEHGGGQVFDHHAVVVAALDSLPGGGTLSLALEEYLDEMPRQQQAAHEEVINWLRDSAQKQVDDEGQALFHSSLLDGLNRLAGQPTRLLADAVARVRAGVPVGPSPLRELTDEQAAKISLAVRTQSLEQGLAKESYAADVARARKLASQRGDWALILDCLI